MSELPAIPDDDADFTPDLARNIIAKYQEIIGNQTNQLVKCERLLSACQHRMFDGPVKEEIRQLLSTGVLESSSAVEPDAVNVPVAGSIPASPATWQPIETAPMDGKPILGFSNKGVSYVCWWRPNGWCFFESHKGDRFYFEPNQWMPLPAAPNCTQSDDLVKP